MTTCPLFVELCAGTAALSLRLQGGKHARPPVSRMGAKTGYADVILRVLGLRPGQGYTDGTRYLWCEPDAGVRLLLHAYTDRDLAQGAAEIIRGWKDEDPRALWERLRAEGPARCPEVLTAREVARWARIVSANELLPLDSRTWQNTGAGGSTFAGNTTHNFYRPVERLAAGFDVSPAVPATIHPDARKVDPREVARWLYVHGRSHGMSRGNSFAPEHNGRPSGGQDGNAPPRAVLSLRVSVLPNIPAAIHPDARTLDPPTLPPGTVAYMDPPYRDTTGYAHDLPRAEVVTLARRWVDAGALVCISEAEPIAALVADGWHSVEITGERRGQRRTFSKQQREWLTLNREPAWRPSVQAGLFG